ncbi:metallophosphoesterase family protein [Curvibacter sp. CHRR-16]|uniref:metallophosphoesterase family protein n=1 Tax=Curvibacter sp. CHRR-16 TaxID=2835872 RepID=UPI001BDAB9B5|nr:metallophosphoesterase family protein [Curvibacter sp. CHRR-16]MBT0570505.1 metallophosphoesterase family protein [Curvibacter sp. CHRR-16]
MRLALLSDIHSNMQAFEACLEHLSTQHIDHIALLGDLVGYGADPRAVVERAMALQAAGATVLQGNHDQSAAEPPEQTRNLGQVTAQWTHRQLNLAQQRWLRDLPLTHQIDAALLVHASADAPAQWRYVYDERVASDSLGACSPDIHWVLGGHVHQQMLYYRGAGDQLMRFTPQAGVPIPVPRHRQWLATVGSVGQPRDGNPAAMYCVLDTSKAQITFHRVDYDYLAAAQAIRAAGLPPFFADRLEEGR